MRNSILVAATLSLTVAACGGDDGHDHDHETTLECQGNEVVTDDVVAGSTMKVKFVGIPTPNPVEAEDLLDFKVQILDSADSPLDSVTVAVEPWQPFHGHGVPTTPVVTPVGSNGEYDAAMVQFAHPGRWELRFHLNEGTTDETITTFVCVAGTPPEM